MKKDSEISHVPRLPCQSPLQGGVPTMVVHLSQLMNLHGRVVIPQGPELTSGASWCCARVALADLRGRVSTISAHGVPPLP